MNVRQFAERYRLRVNDRKIAARCRLSHAEEPVLGRYGELTEIEETFCVRFLAVPRNAVMTGALRSRYRQALKAGLVCKWHGDAESIFEFDPENAEQVALIVRLVGAKYRRKPNPVSPEVLERLRIARECRLLTKESIKSGSVEMNAAGTWVEPSVAKGKPRRSVFLRTHQTFKIRHNCTG